MSEENGWTEPYRVRFTLPVGEILVKWAKLESRSIPSLIQDLVIDAIYHRITEKDKSAFKIRIIHGEEKV
jgi:hypothetical protein